MSEPGQCAGLIEGWHAEWLRSRLGHWGDMIEWATARSIAEHLDQAITLKIETPFGTGENMMASEAVIRKAAEYARERANSRLSDGLAKFGREGPRSAEYDFQVAGSLIAVADQLDRMLPNETGKVNRND